MQVTVDTSAAVPVVRISGDMRLWGKQGFADAPRRARRRLAPMRSDRRFRWWVVGVPQYPVRWEPGCNWAPEESTL